MSQEIVPEDNSFERPNSDSALSKQKAKKPALGLGLADLIFSGHKIKPVAAEC